MKQLTQIIALSFLFISLVAASGCKKCTDAELADKLAKLDTQESTELARGGYTSSQVKAIGEKYDRYRDNARKACE